MTTQYNVVTYGTLTNTNGVLSNFSASNYATIPLTFNPVQHPYEIVFKVNTETMPTNANGIIWQTGDVSSARGRLDLEVYEDKLYSEFAANEDLVWNIDGITTLSSDTDYYAKLTYNGVDTYSLYLSTDGTTWTTEGTATSSGFLGDGTAEYNIIGVQPDNGDMIIPWFGSIDLNESYINVDGIRWWQGTTSDINLNNLIINKLTKAQYENISTPSPTELYMVTDEPIDNEIFVATYGTTTYAEITTALANYKTVICNDSGRLYYYIRSVGGHTFGSSFGANAEYIFIDSNSTWSRGSIYLANKDLSNVTSINSNSAVQTALDSKADTDLSNLSSTGQAVINAKANTSLNNLSSTGTKVLNGQWVSVSTTLANSVSLNGSSNLTYTLSLPDSTYKYEVLLDLQIETGSTSGNRLNGAISTDIVSDILFCSCRTRTASTMQASGSAIVPVSTSHKVYLLRHSNYNGTATLRFKGYRRIGTNS